MDTEDAVAGRSRSRVSQIPASAGIVLAARLTQQQDQDDQGNRNADQPEENGHVVFLSSFEGIIG